LVRGVCRLFLRETPDAADEAARAAFLLLARNASSLSAQKNVFLAGWLHGAAIFAASAMRGRQRSPSDASAGHGGTALSGDGREALHESIWSLPPRQREPVLLASLCGLGDEELSRRMELPQGEIRELLDNGRLRLSRMLESLGMDASEASVSEWLDDEAKDFEGGAGGALVEWGGCTPNEPLGPVSQKVREAADAASARMARSAAGKKLGYVAVAAGVLAVAAVATILLRMPARNAAGDQKAPELPQVTSVSGAAEFIPAGGEARPAKAGDVLAGGSAIRTDRSAEAALAYPDGSRLTLREDGQMASDSSGPAVRLSRGSIVAEASGKMALVTEHVAVTFSGGRAMVLVGKVDKPFTRVDVSHGVATCVAGGTTVAVKQGFAVCFGEGRSTRAFESEGQEFAAVGGGVFLRSVAAEYDVTGLRLDQPKFAHTVEMWRQSGLDMEGHFSGSKTADAGLGRDETGLICWTIRAAKGSESGEEQIPIRAEGDVVWTAIQFAIKPSDKGAASVDLAGGLFVPGSLPPAAKQRLQECAGAQHKVEPLKKSTWTIKWAQVGGMPDGAPLYECESRIDDGPVVKEWRAGTIEKIRIRFNGAEFRIYGIKGGVLEKAPVRKAQ
jgi:DNA-directed RNA polymerase specialized sigma24 family protein